MPRSPSGSTHHLIKQRLCEVSRENNSQFGTQVDKTTGSPTRKARTGKSDETPPSPLRRFQSQWERFEEWGYQNFPVITDHLNLLFHSVDLAIRSVRWFQFGIIAVWFGFRLIIFSIMLLPPLVGCMLKYYHDKRIHRRIRFGPADREYLDIYVPKEAVDAQRGKGEKVPVVIAVMGGAFIIGHRGYNAQLGMKLMEHGVITVGIDYRNFPRGLIADMVEDVSRGVRWVFQNIEVYGGDVNNMMLLGQSAGAHLTAMLLLEHCLLQCKAEANNDDTMPRFKEVWSVRQLKGYLGVSGPYELEKLGPHLASRGLYPKIMHHLTGGDLSGCSPERLLDTEEWSAVKEQAADLLPPIHLFHGYEDKAVPVWSSSDFAEMLDAVGVKNVTLDLRRGMRHTYPVIEGPMKRHDVQCEIILPILFGEGWENPEKKNGKLPAMWPEKVIDFAGAVCPF